MLFGLERFFVILKFCFSLSRPSNTSFEVLHIAHAIGTSVGYGGNGS